ncbi:hypothetical protein IQ235_01835 [Oscillatoriales cyanobacterium LEGE 11467]|uniref:Uncharacterized protein n=1 Tax=Zarconia navalis LEGE 11467 TaxID=1828826 RepID=A0A928Z874_9CYAN|nr:hypothetical protein [Zarconia navalis]MBE9039536.1 hypothetical protein [Zarconia navalis LEGE 11467]
MTGTLKLFKKVAATFLLIFGVPLSVWAIAEIVNPNSTSEDREDAIAALAILTLPPTALGSWLVWGLHKEHQQKLNAQFKAEGDLLQSVFFRILEDNGGQMTILRLAKEAQISGEEARVYLDRKAVEFNATFEVGEQGEITYQFHL